MTKENVVVDEDVATDPRCIAGREAVGGGGHGGGRGCSGSMYFVFLRCHC